MNETFEYYSTPELAILAAEENGGEIRGIQRYEIEKFCVWTCLGPVIHCSREQALYAQQWWKPEFDLVGGIPFNFR